MCQNQKLERLVFLSSMTGRVGTVSGLDMGLCVSGSDFYLSEEALLMLVSAGFHHGSEFGRTHPA